MLRIIIVLLLVYKTQQCCPPPVWEGKEVSLVSVIPPGETTPHIIKGDYYVYSDSGRKMVVLSGTTEIDGTRLNAKTIQDYNKNIQYELIGGTCRKQRLSNFRGNCIPATAVKYSPFLPSGDIKIPAQFYQFERDGLQISMSVDNNCIPFGQSFYGIQEYQSTFGSTTFTNIKPQFGFNSSLFEIPSICNKQNGLSAIGR